MLTYDPEVAVHSTTTITLDGDEAARFGHSVDQPVSSDGQFMGVFWNTNTGGTGFTFAGNADRLYAKPLRSSATGTVESYLNWMLSQPDAELIGPGSPVPLKSLGGGPALESRAFPVVDAGSVAALRTGSARKAIALVAGDCGDLGPAAAALSAAGAVAVVAYAGAGADCAGTIGEAALPVFEARPFDVLGLLEHNRPARIVTHESPHYIYDLAGAWNGFVPERRCPRGRHSEAGGDRRALRLTRAGGERRASGLGDAARLDARRLRRLRPRPAGGGAEHGHALRQSGRGVGANGRGARRRWRHRRLPLRAEARLRRGHDDAGRVVRRADHLARRPPDRAVGLQLALPPGGLLPARDAAVRRPGGPPGRCPLPGRVRRTALPGRGAHRRGRRSALPAGIRARRSATTTGSSTRSSATTPSGSDRAGRRPNGSSARSGRRAITR